MVDGYGNCDTLGMMQQLGAVPAAAQARKGFWAGPPLPAGAQRKRATTTSTMMTIPSPAAVRLSGR